MRRIILTGSLLLAFSAGAMASQVYKWVDAQGNTHFGSQPPLGQEATSINTVVAPPKPTAPVVPEPVEAGDPEQQALDDKVKKEVAAKEVERKKYCTEVRNNLAQLRNNPRVMVEAEGETRRLTEEERQARIAESEKAITENCK